MLDAAESFDEITAAKVDREIASDGARSRIMALVASLAACNGMTPKIAAFGIDCTLSAIRKDSDRDKVEIVWTGPESSEVPVRQSAAVLLELIESARIDLIIMSFASFRIPDAEAALFRAAKRGVKVYLILESPEESSGRYHAWGEVPFGKLSEVGGVSFLSWPKEKRPDGAVLHAKAVVADGERALVTSANLTERAIDVNIELGLLVSGGRVPARLRAHVMSLMDGGAFEEVRNAW
jgi:phosphatidylserine/phosphatidylglycerophosphate/cardiolipin synthase-like enzyme